MTTLSFFAPSDAGALRVRLRSPAGSAQDWIATPFDPVRTLSGVPSGEYTATLEPMGELPVDYVFTVRERSGDVEVRPPTIKELRSQSGALEQIEPASRNPTEAPHSDADPQGSVLRRITIGLSENVPYRRAHWQPYLGSDVRVELTNSGLDVIIADETREREVPRLRISMAVEKIRIERFLVPRYRGGVKVSFRPGSLATADMNIRVVPVDPGRRALVQTLGARTGAEAAVLARDLRASALFATLRDPAGQDGDPWGTTVLGLLSTRFPAFAELADEVWRDLDLRSIGWLADAHVLAARRRLAAAAGTGSSGRIQSADEALSKLTSARRLGAPYFGQTNRLMGEMLGALADKAPVEVQRKQALHERDRWRKTIKLSGGANPTFSWMLSNRNSGEIGPEAGETLYAPTRGELSSTFSRILFEGEVALGQIRPRPPSAGLRPRHSTSQRQAGLSSSLDLDPPALERPVLHEDDPNKGRFGGDSLKAGFRLGVSFGKTRGRWVDLTLFVAAESGEVKPFEDVVDFFLHDTFEPERLRATFRGIEAQISIVSSGGFTVGAWLPRQAVELELDLATVPLAPRRIVRF